MKFILTGTYSSFNKGDAAMQLATAAALKNKWPEALVVIATPFPRYDIATYSEYKIVASNRRRLIRSTVLLLLCYVYSALAKFGIHAPFLLASDELKEIESADIVIDLSGDTITEDYGPHVTYSHLLPLMQAQALKTKTYICGQSMGPFKLTRGLVVYVLKRCTGITAREQITYDYLLSIGVPHTILSLESDMAFSLKPASAKRTSDILESEHISLTTKTLGVTVSNIIRDQHNKHSTTDFYTFFGQLLDDIIQKHDVNILFIGHVTGPSEDKDDRKTALHVLETMRYKNRATILEGNYTPGELKGVIGRCQYFFGARMHSNIGALSSGVPTVAMSYSHKTLGIMSSVGMEKYVVPGKVLEYSTVVDLINRMISAAPAIQVDLTKSALSTKASALVNIDNIDTIVSGKAEAVIS